MTTKELHKLGWRIKNGEAVRVDPTEPRKPHEKINGVYDSKLEAAFAQHLEYLRLAKEVVAFVHHPPPIGTTKVNRYTPDFLIAWADGRIEFAEVKGAVREDDTYKCQIVKDLCPQIGVVMWRRVRGSWIRREF